MCHYYLIAIISAIPISIVYMILWIPFTITIITPPTIAIVTGICVLADPSAGRPLC